MPEFDPVQVEVWRHLFASIAEEMGATLERTAYSPNIKERRDHSCALFDADGRLLAQAAHIPVHLGAMPLMMERLRTELDWTVGSMWLCNDPRHGGTHLPDLTLVAPVTSAADRGPGVGARGQRIAPETGVKYLGGRRLLGFVANRAHHADIGGLSPGSLPLSTELFHEGIIVPPVRLVSAGGTREDVLALVCANSRTPSERRGDLAAQVAANRTGARRLRELYLRHGGPAVRLRGVESLRYAEAAVRAVLRAAPDASHTYTAWMDDDGAGTADLPVTVTATIQGDSIEFDFTGTAPETAGSINAPEAVTRSACYYAVRCLIDEEIPMNAGAFIPIRVIAPPGSLVNPSAPRAVAAGNVETSQRIVDALLGALAPLFPNLIPAASQGTMNNVTIGGWDPFRQSAYAYYETICGGAGASPRRRGASAIHTHMTNTRNTPIEALEMHYPLRVLDYRVRDGSGGPGMHPGGEGVVRSLELLAPAQVTLLTERRRHAPPGSGSGQSGEPGRNSIRPPGGAGKQAPGKTSIQCPAGTVVTVETPGGGGWGPSEPES